MIDDGGPAFPEPKYIASGDTILSESRPGMDLRDYFAAKALQGMAANNANTPQIHGLSHWPMAAAAWAYGVADAMIAERNKS